MAPAYRHCGLPPLVIWRKRTIFHSSLVCARFKLVEDSFSSIYGRAEKATSYHRRFMMQQTTKLKRKLLLIVLALLLASLVPIYVIAVQLIAADPLKSDFSKLYMSADFFLNGESMYTPVSIYTWGEIDQPWKYPEDLLHPNLNPPLQTLLFLPLTLLDYYDAIVVWSILSGLAGVISVLLIMKYAGHIKLNGVTIIAALLLLLIYYPTLMTVLYAQVSLFLFLFVTLVWLAARHGHRKTAGVILGLTMSLKAFTLFFLLLFFVRRQWLVLILAGGTMVLLNGLAVLLAGWSEHQAYLAALDTITWYGASWNASFLGFFSRIFGGTENIPWINAPHLTYVISGALSVLFVLLNIVVVRPCANNQYRQLEFDVGFGLAIVSMLLLSPLGWIYYFPLLIIPMIVIWQGCRTLRLSRYYLILLLTAWLLSSFPHPLIPSEDINNPWQWFILAGTYLYALLLLTILLTFVQQRARSAG